MKTGQYTARIEARRAELLALKRAGVVEPTPNYDSLFTEDDVAMEERVEREIIERFGGPEAMIATFEAELIGQQSMTAAETIAYLRTIAGDVE